MKHYSYAKNGTPNYSLMKIYNYIINIEYGIKDSQK